MNINRMSQSQSLVSPREEFFMLPPVFRALTLLGGCVVARQMIRAGWFMKTYLSVYQRLWSSRSEYRLEYMEARYGRASWVVVTNATTTLGRAYCIELAKRNFHLVLLDSNPSHLQELSHKLKKKFPLLMTTTIKCDTRQAAQQGWTDTIMNQLGSLDISILVNLPPRDRVLSNCSMTPCTDVSSERIRTAMIQSNFPAVLLTNQILPRLSNRYQKLGLHGAVITVTWVLAGESSVVPGCVLPAALNSLVRNYSLASGIEYSYSDRGVDSLSVTPLWMGVATDDSRSSASTSARSAARKYNTTASTTNSTSSNISIGSMSTSSIDDAASQSSSQSRSSHGIDPLAEDGLVVVSPRTSVQASLNQLGRRRETCGWWFHGVLWNFWNLVPPDVLYFIKPWTLRMRLFRPKSTTPTTSTTT